MIIIFSVYRLLINKKWLFLPFRGTAARSLSVCEKGQPLAQLIGIDELLSDNSYSLRSFSVHFNRFFRSNRLIK